MEEHKHHECHPSDEMVEDMDLEELALGADAKVEALVELLIKKGIISEEEYDKALDEFCEADIEDEESDEPAEL